MVDLYNSTNSVTVKLRVRVSVGFRTKDSRFYWGRKVKNSPTFSHVTGGNVNISADETPQQQPKQRKQQQQPKQQFNKNKDDEMTRIPFKVDILKEISYSGDDPNNIPTWNEWFVIRG